MKEDAKQSGNRQEDKNEPTMHQRAESTTAPKSSTVSLYKNVPEDTLMMANNSPPSQYSLAPHVYWLKHKKP